MAKRHPALVPVARDHHEGLLLAVRLQQGEKALERLWSHDTAWQARFVVDFFNDHLIRHFAVEEVKIFSLADVEVPASRSAVEELKRHVRQVNCTNCGASIFAWKTGSFFRSWKPRSEPIGSLSLK